MHILDIFLRRIPISHCVVNFSICSVLDESPRHFKRKQLKSNFLCTLWFCEYGVSTYCAPCEYRVSTCCALCEYGVSTHCAPCDSVNMGLVPIVHPVNTGLVPIVHPVNTGVSTYCAPCKHGVSTYCAPCEYGVSTYSQSIFCKKFEFASFSVEPWDLEHSCFNKPYSGAITKSHRVFVEVFILQKYKHLKCLSIIYIVFIIYFIFCLHT